MTYKAVVFDIDGTLTSPLCCTVSSAVKQAALRLQHAGIKIIIATGRTPNFGTADALHGFSADYIVGTNGSSILDSAGNTVFEHTLSAAQVKRIIDYADLQDAELAFAFTDGYWAYSKYEQAAAGYVLKGYDGVTMHNGQDRTRHLSYAPTGGILRVAPEKSREFEQGFASSTRGLRLVQIFPGSYDICRKDMSKAQGVGRLLRTLGISWRETAALGDGYNDLEMVSRAGLGIAMGNACEELKAAAKLTTCSYEQDGAAVAVEKYILEEKA